MAKPMKLTAVLTSPKSIYIILFLITLMAGVFFVLHTKQVQDDEMRNNLITYAKTIEKSIDWQPFVTTLNTDPNQIQLNDLAELNSKLNGACRVNLDCHFIYLLYLDKNQDKHQVRFLLDSSPQPPSEISKLTEVFVEASDDLRRAMKLRAPMVEGPVTDHWGSWVSVRVPVSVTARTAHFVMLNVDVVAADWRKRLLAETFLPSLIILFFLTILTGLILRNRYIENLLAKLFDSTSELSELAYFDALTGLPNRRLLEDRAAQAFSAAKRSKQMVAVMFLDLDYFKVVNDTHGHDVGDLLLKSVAERLKNLMRTEDTVCRIGGDEFVMLLPKIVDERQATVAAEKVIKALMEPFVMEGKVLRIGGSIGVAIYSKHGATPTSLLKCADEAMYSAKRLGRNIYVLYADDSDLK